MRQVRTRGGVFGSGGYGGGLFDGSNSGFGGLGATYEQAAAGVGAIQDPTGQTWNNTTYQACMGHQVQKCGAEGYAYKWSAAETNACIEAAQKGCIAAAKAAATSLSKAQVIALQQAINAKLQQYNYCPIGVDGNLGPTTCGAAAWAAGVGAAGVTVPGACGTTVKVGSGFLKDCAPGTPPPEPEPVTPPAPPPVAPPPVTPPVAPPPVKKKGGVSTAWVVGGLLAAGLVAGVAVAASKKKH